MTMTMEYLAGLPRLIGAAAIVLALIAGIWRLLDWRTKFDDLKEILEKENWAYAVQRGGILVGSAIAISAALSDFDRDQTADSLMWLGAKAIWIFAAILLARPIIDWILLPKIRNDTLIVEGNLALAIVEAAAYTAVGFMLAGSLTGTAPSRWLTIGSTVAFYALGLGVVTAVYWLQEWVTPYSLHDRLKEGDVSAAVEVGGILVAVAMVVQVGVAGDFVDWITSLKAFGLTAAFGIVVLYASRWLVNRFVLMGHSLKSVHTDRNVVAASTLATVMVVVAMAVKPLIQFVL